MTNDRSSGAATRRRLNQSVKRWPGWLALLFVVVALLVVGYVRETGPRSTQERIEDISKRLACPVCDGESVFESSNASSTAIRTEIRRQVTSGTATDDQIIAFIEDRFDGNLLLVPKATGIDALVWALPVAAFVCAVVGLGVAFRRWRLAADTVPNEADRDRVTEELSKTVTDE
jgi:cytochrome c-type biogenesis protein CcmH